MTFSVKALNLSTKVALPIKSRVCLVVQYLKNERILSEGQRVPESGQRVTL